MRLREFNTLSEGAALPGVTRGIKVMTPQQFVAKSGDMPGEEDVKEAIPQKPLMAVSMERWKQAILNRYPEARFVTQKMINGATIAMDETGQVGIYDPKNSCAKVGPKTQKVVDEGKWDPITGGDHPTDWTGGELESGPSIEKFQAMLDYYGNDINVTRALDDLYRNTQSGSYYDLLVRQDRYLATIEDRFGKTYKRYFPSKREAHAFAKGYGHVVTNIEKIDTQEDTSDLITLPVMLGIKDHKKKWMLQFPSEAYAQKWEFKHKNVAKILWDETHPLHRPESEAVAESLDRIRSLVGLDEATKLPVQARDLVGKELEDYLERIRTQEKGKTDKYKLPYIHRSSVVKYYSPEGKRYDVDAIKAAIGTRPTKLLKKNEKMKHSDGSQEQFFNVGFAALVGIALDESTGNLIVVNTCPGAGSCKVDCFAMKGGKIQFEGPWLSDARILTYLLNDPGGFFNQLMGEISAEVAKGNKKDYKVSIRWHDAGDFFSPEYVDMAFKLARSLPEVDFYAYTKVADVALGQKPDNFMINWSEGASTSQEKKIKAADPTLAATKNSRIVPSKLFYDLLVKDEKKNLVKGPEGQWQVIPEKLPELKERLASEYGISKNSILSYKQWETRGKNIPNMKWNVIITPGEPDLTAKDPGVLSTLLLKH